MCPMHIKMIRYYFTINTISKDAQSKSDIRCLDILRLGGELINQKMINLFYWNIHMGVNIVCVKFKCENPTVTPPYEVSRFNFWFCTEE